MATEFERLKDKRLDRAWRHCLSKSGSYTTCVPAYWNGEKYVIPGYDILSKHGTKRIFNLVVKPNLYLHNNWDEAVWCWEVCFEEDYTGWENMLNSGNVFYGQAVIFNVGVELNSEGIISKQCFGILSRDVLEGVGYQQLNRLVYSGVQLGRLITDSDYDINKTYDSEYVNLSELIRFTSLSVRDTLRALYDCTGLSKDQLSKIIGIAPIHLDAILMGKCTLVGFDGMEVLNDICSKMDRVIYVPQSYASSMGVYNFKLEN